MSFVIVVSVVRLCAERLPPCRAAVVCRQVITLDGRNLVQTRTFRSRLAREHYAHHYLLLVDYCSANADLHTLLLNARQWHLSIALYGAELCHQNHLPAQLAAVAIDEFYDERMLPAPPRRVEAPAATADEHCACRALGISLADSHDRDTVKRAYRTLALRYHPDKLPPGASAEERQAASAAFHAVESNYSALCRLRNWT